MGLSPSDIPQREVLLRFVNEAAIELYQMSDMAGCLEEQYFQVNPNQTVSLPDYVGQLRAMRQADTNIALQLSQMRPRYNQFNWEQEWRNWRVKGLETLQRSISNQSILTISVPLVENPPIVVNISGSSSNSANVTETIVMDELTKLTTNNYNDVNTFTKDRVNNYNVVLTDVDNNVLTYIPNNKLKAQFQIVDISGNPWFPPTSDPKYGWVEVLYKKALPWFQNDTDEFPVVGYDNVIVNKCLQLYFEEQAKPELAIAYYQKAQQSLAQIHEDTNRGTDDVVSLVENPHDKITHRIGFGRDYRYAYRIVGR